MGSEINLNDASPAAPSHAVNVKWQKGATSGTDPVYDIPIYPVSANVAAATASVLGVVKPDAQTINVASDGTLTAAVGGVLLKTASYTATAGDCGKLLSFNSSSAVTLTLPATAPFAQWNLSVENTGTGTLTVSPGALQLDGATSSVTLAQNSGLRVFTDATNYFTQRGAAGASTPIATATTVGTVKPGTGLSVATDGTLNLSLSAPHFVSNTASASSNTGANLVATFGANVTAGSAILVILAPGPGHNPGATITSITDNHGNSYSLVMNVPGVGPDGFGTYYGSQLIYAAYNVAAGATTITVVYSQLNNQLSLLALEYAGVVSASPVDGTPASIASSGTSLTAGPVTTANANDLLISSNVWAGTPAGVTNAPSADFTQEATVSLGGRPIWVADKAVSATGSYSTTWTNNDTGGAASKTVALFALKSAGASSAFVTSFNGRAGIVTSQPGDYTDAQISFSDITTNNVSTSAHGYAPKLPGDATKYLDGTGAFSVPSSSGITLTTTGTSGAATLSSGVLNIPVYSGGGGGALTLISSQVLASSAASVTFSSIPGSYAHLRIVYTARGSSSADNIAMQLNGDTGSNYDTQILAVNSNTTASSVPDIGVTACDVGTVPGSSAPTGQAGSGEIVIYNYAGTTFWKNFTAHNYRKDANTNAGSDYNGYGGTWRGTPAVTTIKLNPKSGGNFIAGSTFSLYVMS